MRTGAVICEYNPFHNGHAYQLEYMKKELGLDHVVAVMSGNFVQRGEPAIFDKYIRAKAALMNGADIVIELPPVFAVSSAGDFASAAVRAVHLTGIADILSFGVEGDVAPDGLWKMAEALDGADPDMIRKMVKAGKTYPEAVCLAAGIADRNLSRPNNILAAEYLRAVRRLRESEGCRIVPVPLKRRGCGYSADLPPDKGGTKADPVDTVPRESTGPVGTYIFTGSSPYGYGGSKCIAEDAVCAAPGDYGEYSGHGRHGGDFAADSAFASAGALRRLILSGEETGDILRRLGSYVPESAMRLYREEIARGRICRSNDMSALLGLRLLDEKYAYADGQEQCRDVGRLSGAKNCGYDGKRTAEGTDGGYYGGHTPGEKIGCTDTRRGTRGLERYLDVSTEIANRLMAGADRAMGFDERVDAVKTRQYTRTRISRALLHIVLGITDGETEARKEAGYTEYLRLLGFTRSAVKSGLLKLLKESAKVPLVTKPADHKELIGRDVRCDGIYYAMAGAGRAYISKGEAGGSAPGTESEANDKDADRTVSRPGMVRTAGSPGKGRSEYEHTPVIV